MKDEEYTGEIARCFSLGGVEEFPVAEIETDIPFFKGRVRACVVEHPIFDLILGNLPGVLVAPELIDGPEVVANIAQTRSQTAQGDPPLRSLQTTEAPKLDVGPEQLVRWLAGIFVGGKSLKSRELLRSAQATCSQTSSSGAASHQEIVRHLVS